MKINLSTNNINELDDSNEEVLNENENKNESNENQKTKEMEAQQTANQIQERKLLEKKKRTMMLEDIFRIKKQRKTVIDLSKEKNVNKKSSPFLKREKKTTLKVALKTKNKKEIEKKNDTKAHQTVIDLLDEEENNNATEEKNEEKKEKKMEKKEAKTEQFPLIQKTDEQVIKVDSKTVKRIEEENGRNIQPILIEDEDVKKNRRKGVPKRNVNKIK